MVCKSDLFFSGAKRKTQITECTIARWAKSTNKRLSFLLSTAAQETSANPNNCPWYPSPGLTPTLAGGHLALLKQCLQNPSCTTLLEVSSLQAQTWSYQKASGRCCRSLPSVTVQSKQRQTRKTYSAATPSDSKLTPQNPHGNNESSRHLSNLTLLSLFGLESTLSSSKKYTLSKKNLLSVWARWCFVDLLLFFCIPINLLALKCWDRCWKARMLWFLCLRKDSFKILKILFCEMLSVNKEM